MDGGDRVRAAQARGDRVLRAAVPRPTGPCLCAFRGRRPGRRGDALPIPGAAPRLRAAECAAGAAGPHLDTVAGTRGAPHGRGPHLDGYGDHGHVRAPVPLPVRAARGRLPPPLGCGPRAGARLPAPPGTQHDRPASGLAPGGRHVRRTRRRSRASGNRPVPTACGSSRSRPKTWTASRRSSRTGFPRTRPAEAGGTRARPSSATKHPQPLPRARVLTRKAALAILVAHGLHRT